MFRVTTAGGGWAICHKPAALTPVMVTSSPTTALTVTRVSSYAGQPRIRFGSIVIRSTNLGPTDRDRIGGDQARTYSNPPGPRTRGVTIL